MSVKARHRCLQKFRSGAYSAIVARKHINVACGMMSFGAVMGDSVNLAGILGPAIDAVDLAQVVPYSIAQFLGAAIAAVLYRKLFARPLDKEKRPDIDWPNQHSNAVQSAAGDGAQPIC